MEKVATLPLDVSYPANRCRLLSRNRLRNLSIM